MMTPVKAIGNPPWDRGEILEHIDEFITIYPRRPVRDNRGGMKSPHMFAVWFMVKKLQPDLIVESGIWKGQSTWLLETACPQARLVSIDINLGTREYISDKALYFEGDFSDQDWSSISDRSVVFFDDHQNAYRRLQQCKWFGFKHAIFEDNYPPSRGDCYSLKKAFAHSGFDPGGSVNNRIPLRFKGFAKKIGLWLLALSSQYQSMRTLPNGADSRILETNLEVYCEFPPVIQPGKTRWGDFWDETYPTPQPLLKSAEKPSHRLFHDEATSYTWVCYAKLK